MLLNMLPILVTYECSMSGRMAKTPQFVKHLNAARLTIRRLTTFKHASAERVSCQYCIGIEQTSVDDAIDHTRSAITISKQQSMASLHTLVSRISERAVDCAGHFNDVGCYTNKEHDGQMYC